MINAILGIDKNYNLKHTHYTAVPVRGATAWGPTLASLV